MADHFCNSVGVLQQCAPPSPFPGFDKQGGKSPAPQPTEGMKHYPISSVIRQSFFPSKAELDLWDC